MDPKCLIPGDATLIENIVNYLKAKGIFDEFRHECLADVDTKSSCQNLSQRVDGYASKFLANETWHPDLNKNELRNKLRRHIDEAGFLAPGADIVVEQAINPKVYHYFLPKVIEVVHQYVKEQTELLNKKPGITSAYKSSISEKPVNDAFENKDKTQISDPIADILSFSFHAKTENIQHKYGDMPKVEKRREEKCIPPFEKNPSEIQTEALTTLVNETKIQLEREKEKIKKEDPEIQPEVIKKTVKDEIKSEKKKAEDIKVSVSEITTSSEESKSNMPTSSKPNVSSKKDDKNKHKFKSHNVQKMSNSSNEIKKPKKESEKSSDKLNKAKHIKSSKESLSPTKMSSSHKSVLKEEKGEISKAKSHDASTSKASESSVKKSKSGYDKKDSNNTKHKGHTEKTDKLKASKSVDKNEHHIHHDLPNSEKSLKNVQYSSSYDSSQGSDQEKSASTNTKKEKSKHFSKHVTKEKSDQPDNSNKIDKKRSNHNDENPSKKYKNEKDVKLKLKDVSVVEAAKISSRSNSFGSTSSVSSSSNASKDNLTSNSDEVSENSAKDKKKKQGKEKDSCQNSPKTLPPPPPPPPPSSSLTSEIASSTEMSSMEDTQSSLSESDVSSSEVNSEESGSDLELECKDLINDTLNESALNSSTDNINAFYDIFLYSSSSSEFEGYDGNSPGKKSALENELNNMHESDISISSVHTSDLSSFDDELSSDDEVAFLTGGLKKRLTLKEAQELIENKVDLIEKNKVNSKACIGENPFSEGTSQKSSSVLSSDDESPPSEPVRLLRRERKLNPRYSSSEYTSIFNCKKESFITKQSSPSVKSQTSSPKTETNLKKTDLCAEKKLANKHLIQDKNIKMDSDKVKISDKNKSKLKKESQDESDQLNDSKMSGSDEVETILDKEKLFKENNKNNLIADDDKLKDYKKLRPHNNSKVRRNSHSLKRKLEIAESTPVKRPCSRSSVDSSSSEFAPNENKPFNSKKDFNEEKKLNDCGLKESNLNIDVKKDLFNKQRTNNNGDILGQKDMFSKNSHSKVINSEKKTSESDASSELNSL